METRGYGLPASTSPDQPADALGSSHPSFAHLKRESPDGTNWVVSIELPLHLPSRTHPRISSQEENFKKTQKNLPSSALKKTIWVGKHVRLYAGADFFFPKRSYVQYNCARVCTPQPSPSSALLFLAGINDQLICFLPKSDHYLSCNDKISFLVTSSPNITRRTAMMAKLIQAPRCFGLHVLHTRMGRTGQSCS